MQSMMISIARSLRRPLLKKSTDCLHEQTLSTPQLIINEKELQFETSSQTFFASSLKFLRHIIESAYSLPFTRSDFRHFNQIEFLQRKSPFHQFTYSTTTIPARMMSSVSSDPFYNDRWKEDNSEEERQALNQKYREQKELEKSEGKTEDTSPMRNVVEWMCYGVVAGVLLKIISRRMAGDEGEEVEPVVSSTSTGVGVTTPQEAASLPLPELISSIGYTNLCLQEVRRQLT